MKWCVVTALLLITPAAARVAHGQTPPDDRLRDKIATAALRASYGATFLVQLYEARTTVRALDAGARETNPLVMPIGGKPELVYLTALGRAGAIDLAVHSIGGRHKFVALGVSAFVNSAYLMVAAHNLQVADQMRRQQIAGAR
jgi:hypothetical protein